MAGTEPLHSRNSTGSPAAAMAAAALIDELRELIVGALNLQDVPADAGAQTPLYGEGLGLDSIDILEVALVVSKRYGVQLKADDDNNQQIFKSLGTLAEYVAAQRTR